jgi:hypothetical protein
MEHEAALFEDRALAAGRQLVAREASGAVGAGCARLGHEARIVADVRVGIVIARTVARRLV